MPFIPDLNEADALTGQEIVLVYQNGKLVRTTVNAVRAGMVGGGGGESLLDPDTGLIKDQYLPDTSQSIDLDFGTF